MLYFSITKKILDCPVIVGHQREPAQLQKFGKVRLTIGKMAMLFV